MQKKSYQLFDKMVLPCFFMLSNIKLYVFGQNFAQVLFLCFIIVTGSETGI